MELCTLNMRVASARSHDASARIRLPTLDCAVDMRDADDGEERVALGDNTRDEQTWVYRGCLI